MSPFFVVFVAVAGQIFGSDRVKDDWGILKSEKFVPQSGKDDNYRPVIVFLHNPFTVLLAILIQVHSIIDFVAFMEAGK